MSGASGFQAMCLPRENIRDLPTSLNSIPRMTVREHRSRKPSLDLLIISIRGFGFHFYSDDLTLENGFDELEDVVGLTFVCEDYRCVASPCVWSCFFFE